MGQNVVILGASNTETRFANRAWRRVAECGHLVYSVGPNVTAEDGQRPFTNLTDVPGTIDTLTIYVNPAVSTALAASIVALRPGRVIFNPGAENPVLARRLDQEGIAHQNACTLVLLDLHQF